MVNFCADGGRLVGPLDHLPVAPWEHGSDPACFVVGCNRLVCGQCGSAVTCVGHYRQALAIADIADVHGRGAFAELEASGVIVRDITARFYACGCQVLTVTETRAPGIAGDWQEELAEYPPPWRCGGHDAPEVPFVVDGVTWSDEASAVQLTRDFLAAGTPKPPPFLTVAPSAWLVRCEALLRHVPLGAAITDTCVAALDDVELATRTRAADYLRYRPSVPGAGRVVRVLRDRPELFSGLKDPFAPSRGASERFFETAAARLLRKVDGPDEVAAIELAIDGGLMPDGMLTRALAERDPTWFGSRMADLLARAPDFDTTAMLVASAARKDHPALDQGVVSLAGVVPADMVERAIRGLVRGARRERLVAALVQG